MRSVHCLLVNGVVDEVDDQPRNQQDRNNDACEDSAFGHGFIMVLMRYSLLILVRVGM